MFDRFRALFAQFTHFFDRLNDRERRLVTWGGIGGGGLIVFLLISGMIAKVSMANTEITAGKAMLEQVLSLSDDFKRAKARQEAQERRFSNNPVSLFTHLQTAAQRHGLPLSDLSETKTPLTGTNLTETSVVLNLRQLSLDRLHAFVSAIEEHDKGSVVKVTRLKTKARFDAPDLMDVTLTVSTWKSTQ